MEEKFQKKISTQTFFLLKHGYLIISIIFLLVVLTLSLIKIDNTSTLKMITNFFWRR